MRRGKINASRRRDCFPPRRKWVVVDRSGEAQFVDAWDVIELGVQGYTPGNGFARQRPILAPGLDEFPASPRLIDGLVHDQPPTFFEEIARHAKRDRRADMRFRMLEQRVTELEAEIRELKADGPKKPEKRKKSR